MKNKFQVAFLITLFMQLNIVSGHALPPLRRYLPKKDRVAIDALTRNVEFKFCKAAIPKNDEHQLNELAYFLTVNKYAVALRGHADAIGTYVGNWKMSEARALSIKTYLVKKGVSEEKIVTTAFGSTIPVADNHTSQGRQRNRRVEIHLKEIGS
jgi:outer membrane protein OmpA-like peptidoglycan-associated protein